MSFPDQSLEGDHSKLPDLHNFFYTVMLPMFLESSGCHISAMAHINPILGHSNVFRKFTNGLVELGIISPRQIISDGKNTTDDVISYLKTPSSSSSDSVKKQDDSTISICDSVDLWNTLIYHGLSTTSQDISLTELVKTRFNSNFDSNSNDDTTYSPNSNGDTIYGPEFSFFFTFHATKTISNARSILRDGYNPLYRTDQVHGSGEYHSSSFDLCRHYGNFIIVNCCVISSESQHSTYIAESQAHCTHNPIETHDKVSYMLPLGIFTVQNVPIIISSSIVLPNIHTPSVVDSLDTSNCTKKIAKWHFDHYCNITVTTLQIPITPSSLIEQLYQHYLDNTDNTNNYSRIAYHAFDAEQQFTKFILDFSTMKTINVATCREHTVVRM